MAKIYLGEQQIGVGSGGSTAEYTTLQEVEAWVNSKNYISSSDLSFEYDESTNTLNIITSK